MVVGRRCLKFDRFNVLIDQPMGLFHGGCIRFETVTSLDFLRVFCVLSWVIEPCEDGRPWISHGHVFAQLILTSECQILLLSDDAILAT